MINTYPNPWNFSNTDLNLISPNQQYKIEYGDLYEIAMGAPIGGSCYLYQKNKKIKISNWAGGPVIWDETSTRLALPLWTSERKQQIGIFDLINSTLTIYQQPFRVLQLSHFDDRYIIGIDSPIYQSKAVHFDYTKEVIEKVQTLPEK
ncbi:hypothetical protein [Myroides sp. TSA_177.3]|uniref:hypothetical protein n=1 Tax=Myroides sp. TSA_177.3 TaxID=3415650 RepID=UPI004046023D